MTPFPTRRRGRVLFALAPIALLMLAACSSGSPASPSPESSGGVVSSGTLKPPTSAPTAPNPVTPQPIKDAHKQAFIKTEAVPGKSAVLVVGSLMTGPPCNVIGRADVTETGDQVTITLWAGARPDAKCDGPQPAMQYPFVIEVPLKEPLGDRTVVDGAQ